MTIAEKLGREWNDIYSVLVSDLIQFQRLLSFEEYSAEELLNRYNVGQC